MPRDEHTSALLRYPSGPHARTPNRYPFRGGHTECRFT